MKSLSSSSVIEKLNKWQELKTSVDSLFTSSSFPVQVEGVSGSLFSFFVEQISKANHVRHIQSLQYDNAIKTFSQDIVIVVPTEREATDVQNDIQSVFPKAEIHKLTGFGVMPYRPVSKGSAVFGERVGVLA